jgi:hypothetical protein
MGATLPPSRASESDQIPTSLQGRPPKGLSLVQTRMVEPVDSTEGRLAQLGERLPYKQEVAGSSPAPPTRRISLEGGRFLPARGFNLGLERVLG